MARDSFPRAARFATGTGNAALDIRVRELVGFLANPQQVRLTEEQRALMLGIARRLVFAVAAQLDSSIDADRLWAGWSQAGIPAAAELALPCFARAEEFRWRGHAAIRVVDDMPSAADAGDAVPPPLPVAPDTIDRAFLALRIADMRRSDPLDLPCLPISDISAALYRTLALDIAAFALAGGGNDPVLARRFGERVSAMLADHEGLAGIDAASLAWYQALDHAGTTGEALISIFQRQQWWAAVALAAGLNGWGFDEAALVMLAGAPADIRQLFDALTMDASAFLPLIASLESLPHRPVGQGGATADEGNLGDLLQLRAAALAGLSPDEAS